MLFNKRWLAQHTGRVFYIVCISLLQRRNNSSLFHLNGLNCIGWFIFVALVAILLLRSWEFRIKKFQLNLVCKSNFLLICSSSKWCVLYQSYSNAVRTTVHSPIALFRIWIYFSEDSYYDDAMCALLFL